MRDNYPAQIKVVDLWTRLKLRDGFGMGGSKNTFYNRNSPNHRLPQDTQHRRQDTLSIDYPDHIPPNPGLALWKVARVGWDPSGNCASQGN